jgi:uncharacterized protein (DUF1330 family)
MPKAYLIANIEVQNPAPFALYREQVAPLIERFGGRYLVRGGAVTDVEGTPELKRVVVLEFPDMATLKHFYHSADYAPLIALRQSCTISHVALVEGYQD